MPRDTLPVGGARVVTAVAPAKINLHLGVGDLRADGYHDVHTVYRAVDMWERVTVAFLHPDDHAAARERPDGGDLIVSVIGHGADKVPEDRTNLAARAVELLRTEAGIDTPIVVQVRKEVPVAGGMAGGSADAAAALLATDRLLGLRLGSAALEERAARLGSDVPFCLRGGTAIGSGRGEKLVPLLHARAEQHIVVVLARGGLSTPEVFAELDRLRADDGEGGAAHELPEAGSTDELLRALGGSDPEAIADLLVNDMEPAALSLMPALHRTLRVGHEAGALHGMVSGSGPTCLFFCATNEHALDVADEIAQAGISPLITVTRGPARGAHITEDAAGYGRLNDPSTSRDSTRTGRDTKPTRK